MGGATKTRKNRNRNKKKNADTDPSNSSFRKPDWILISGVEPHRKCEFLNVLPVCFRIPQEIGLFSSVLCQYQGLNDSFKTNKNHPIKLTLGQNRGPLLEL